MKHEENRKRVCFSCFIKVKVGENLESASALIKERVNRLLPSVDLSDDRLPLGFCLSCKAKLKKFEDKQLKEFDLSKLNEYLASQPRSSPRSDCACTVCEIATAGGLQSRNSVKTGV